MLLRNHLVKAPSISIKFEISGFFLSSHNYVKGFRKISLPCTTKHMSDNKISTPIFIMAVGMSLKFGYSAQIDSLFCIYWRHGVREGQVDLPCLWSRSQTIIRSLIMKTTRTFIFQPLKCGVASISLISGFFAIFFFRVPDVPFK